MGASSFIRTYPGDLSVDVVRKQFRDAQHDALIEDGNSPYSGSIATIDSLGYDAKIYPTVREAVEKITEDTRKREAKIAKAHNVKTSLVKTATFKGITPFNSYDRPLWEQHYRWGRSYEQQEPVYADQLTAEQVEKIKELRDFRNFELAVTEQAKIHDVLMRALRESIDPQFIAFDKWDELKQSTREMRVRVAARDMVQSALKTYCRPLKEALYVEQTVDEGLVWVIAGWVAE